MLKSRNIDLLVDVRSFPSSRHCPQWNMVEIENDCPFDYLHLPALGGKRKCLPKTQTINGAWRNASFRGYADYMQTDDFADGLTELQDLAIGHNVAFMCAEAVWWKCHRSMIADALVSQGWQVTHIMDSDSEHTLRDFAVVERSKVFYPALH
jgi:uncharacterized protein (DUF488 family)